MSILKVDAIRDNGSGFNDVVTFANSGGTQNATLCRTWVNFNGVGTVGIRNDFNVNSITDGGTGRYQVNFSNALPTSNYSGTFGTDGVYNGACAQFGYNDNDESSNLTTSTKVSTRSGDGGGGSLYDAAIFCVAIFC